MIDFYRNLYVKFVILIDKKCKKNYNYTRGGLV